MQALLCIFLTISLAVSAIRVLEEGTARKANDPAVSIYTPEIAAEHLKANAPVFLLSLTLTAAGLLLGIRDEKAQKPVRDPEVTLDLLLSRIKSPSETMKKEGRTQKIFLLAGRSLFGLCMIPTIFYFFDPAHFPEGDLEIMFSGLIKVILPFTALGVTSLAVCLILREKSMLREIEMAKIQLKKEKTAGTSPDCKPSTVSRHIGLLQVIFTAAALCFIVAGICNQGARDVLYKAITICTECIGLG